MINVLQIISVPVKVKNSFIGVNGPERRMANVMSKWEEYGIRVFYMYPSRGQLYSKFSESNRCDDYEIQSKYNLFSIYKIARFAKKNKIDVIHTHGPASLDLLAAIASKFASCKIIMSRPSFINNIQGITWFRRFVYNTIDKLNYYLVDHMTVVSKEGLHRVKISNKSLIHNGVDLGLFKPIIKKNEEIIKIVKVAQLKEGKGWSDFINIIEELYKIHTNIEAHIIGEGDLKLSIHNLVVKKNLESVIKFHGHLENIQDELKNMDIFLFTSYSEGLSVAIIESLAMGLPIVTTNVGGIEEQVVHDANGFIHAVGDIQGMVNSLSKLIKSDDLRTQFGQFSRLIAEKSFNQEKMILEYVQTYHKVCP